MYAGGGAPSEFFELDLRSGEIQTRGKWFRLQEKAFQTLVALTERPGETVTRQELYERLWRDAQVEFNDCLNHAIKKLREVLEDSASNPRFIETLPRHGYRFIAPVTRSSCHRILLGYLGPQPLPPRRSVGREGGLSELRGAWNSITRGSGLMVCVTGEPGIGKTTLVEDFIHEVTAKGPSPRAIRGRCSECLIGTEVYLPIMEALESLLEDGKTRLLLQEVAPSWYLQIAPAPASDPSFLSVWNGTSAVTQERRKREIDRLFHELARDRPLIFFLDDLHWADLATIDLLSYIGSHCETMSTLIIGAYRPAEMLIQKHPFLPVKLELQGRGVCREIRVPFLSKSDVEEYLNIEFPDHRFPEAFAQMVHARTEGNPLFVVDLLRDLSQRGLIVKDRASWVLAEDIPDVRAQVPESTRGIITRRIERLGDEDRRLLTLASILGQEFHSAVLSRMSGLNTAHVEERLEELGRVHGLVRFVGEEQFPDFTPAVRYRFVHVLYQHAFSAHIPPSGMTALCLQAVGALTDCFSENIGAIASELGRLWEAARNYERACYCFLLAAQKARQAYASEKAIVLARRAIVNAHKLSGESQQRYVLAAACQMAQAHLSMSQFEEALADFETARVAAEATADFEGQVFAICGKAHGLFWLKRAAGMRSLADQALRLAQAAGSNTGMGCVESILGIGQLAAGNLSAGEEYLKRAAAALRESGPMFFGNWAVLMRAAALGWGSQYREANRVIEWAVENARHTGTHLLVSNLFFQGRQLANEGRISEAARSLEEGMRIAEEDGTSLVHCATIPNTLGWLYGEMQHPELALKFNSEGIRLGREVGFAEAEAYSHINLARVHLTVGDYQQAGEHLGQAERIIKDPANVCFRWLFDIHLQAATAEYWIEIQDFGKAASCAGKSLAIAQSAQAGKHIAWAHKLLGDIAGAEERFPDAQQQFGLALEELSRHPCPLIEWKTLLPAAEAAKRCRKRSEAEDYSRRGRQVVQSLAASVADDHLRRRFLSSESVRKLNSVR